jgi:hypothetical protein
VGGGICLLFDICGREAINWLDIICCWFLSALKFCYTKIMHVLCCAWHVDR